MLRKLKKYNKFDLLGYFLFNFLLKILKNKFYGIKYLINSFLFNIKVGKNHKVYGNIYFSKFPNSTIKIGDNFNSVNDYKISSFNFVPATRFKTFLPSSKIIIGNGVHINSSSLLCNSKSIIIGDNVLIAPNCIITDSDFHGIDPNKRNERDINKDKNVIVEKNVWICMNTVITKGVKIGKNSVIGAGSVVINDVEANSLYAGNPAKFIRKI